MKINFFLTRKQAFILGCLAWLVLAAVGIGMLEQYAGAPTEDSALDSSWPKATRLSRSEDLPTFILFLHPECSCSRASVEELAKLQVSLGERFKIFVVFVRPAPEMTVQTSLWDEVQRLPDVDMWVDEGGEQAELFQARSSGQSFLFSKNGHLLFAGGITPARGHVGDNKGSQIIRKILAGAPTKQIERSPVFGCALLNKGPQRATQVTL